MKITADEFCGRADAQPTIDEQAGIAWWNSLDKAERAQALEAAGWSSSGTEVPSVADAWTVYTQRSRAAAGGRKPLRFVVLLGRYGQPPHVFDTRNRCRMRSYASVAEAERQALLMNRL